MPQLLVGSGLNPAPGGAGGSGGAVDSVFGRTGDVTADPSDYDGIYLPLGTAKTVTVRHTFNPAVAGAPFLLGANANAKVTNFNSDLLDGLDSLDFALASHTHSAADITSGQLSVTRGGTAANLSATGGANKAVWQESAGAAFTVRVIASGDLPDLSSIYQPLDADLTAIAAFSSTGIACRTASNTWAQRTVAAGSSKITVTNPGGVAGNITLDAAIAESDVTFTDITTNNVSTSKHGYAPKAPNDATKYLDGTGAYSVPAGGSASPGGSDTQVQYNNGGAFGGAPGMVYDDGTTVDMLTLTAQATGDRTLVVKQKASQNRQGVFAVLDSSNNYVFDVDFSNSYLFCNMNQPSGTNGPYFNLRTGGTLKGSFGVFNGDVYFYTNGATNFIVGGDGSTGITVTIGRNSAETLALVAAKILAANLPTSDPHVAGQLWRSTNDVKISTG